MAVHLLAELTCNHILPPLRAAVSREGNVTLVSRYSSPVFSVIMCGFPGTIPRVFRELKVRMRAPSGRRVRVSSIGHASGERR